MNLNSLKKFKNIQKYQYLPFSRVKKFEKEKNLFKVIQFFLFFLSLVKNIFRIHEFLDRFLQNLPYYHDISAM